MEGSGKVSLQISALCKIPEYSSELAFSCANILLNWIPSNKPHLVDRTYRNLGIYLYNYCLYCSTSTPRLMIGFRFSNPVVKVVILFISTNSICIRPFCWLIIKALYPIVVLGTFFTCFHSFTCFFRHLEGI